MLEHLQKHPYVSQVIEDGMAVICICGKQIVFKSKYNKAYLDSHVNEPGCNWSSGTHAITEFFCSSKKDYIFLENTPVRYALLNKDQQEQLNYAERMQAK
ncbi:562_t:CDS:2 [Cetraspora pellucida]|uniref:562_t:CDS:1 n=1 Tax=Cetraspora pellucida TaxID=1433469 RepID=A0A9N9JXZ6_9GLOM|nr:562_t:CDS:2 [Cetraspora pellucida]